MRVQVAESCICDVRRYSYPSAMLRLKRLYETQVTRHRLRLFTIVSSPCVAQDLLLGKRVVAGQKTNSIPCRARSGCRHLIEDILLIRLSSHSRTGVALQSRKNGRCRNYSCVSTDSSSWISKLTNVGQSAVEDQGVEGTEIAAVCASVRVT